jgi:hypothetical protein
MWQLQRVYGWTITTEYYFRLRQAFKGENAEFGGCCRTIRGAARGRGAGLHGIGQDRLSGVAGRKGHDLPDKNARREDRLLDAAYLDQVESLPLDDLRRRRDECRDLEAEFSYARRLLQGKIDILASELRRRAQGGETGVEDLVGRLPSILAEQPAHSGTTKRLLNSSLPANAGQFRREAERLAADVAQIEDLSLEELSGMVDKLSEAERKVSEERRLAQRMVDGLNGELVRRYRKGDADPSALLSS